MIKYKSLFNRIEVMILVFCILCIFFLIIFQGIFSNNSNTAFTSYNHLVRGINYEPEMKKEVGYIIFRIEDKNFSNLTVLINGKDKYKFGDNAEIKLKVHDDDVVELDSTMYNEKIIVKIVGISKNILFPKLSTEITTNSRIDVIGSVILN